MFRLFSSCSEQGLLFNCGAWASHCSGFSCEVSTSVVVAHGLSCSWNVGSSRNRDQTMSPASAGRFLTTGPAGKSLDVLIFSDHIKILSQFLCHPTSGPSLYNPIFSFLAWAALPCVSLMFENSTLGSTERWGERRQSAHPFCFMGLCFWTKVRWHAWIYCFLSLLRPTVIFVCSCEYLTTEGVIPVFQDKCVSHNRANKHKPTLHLVLKEEETICF